MRISRKTQNTIKGIVSAILVIATILGAASLFKGFADDDGLIKVSPTFTVGGLNVDGKYIETDGTIYTKEAFECQGLKIELDFEKTIFYEVYFYDENGNFLSATEKTNENSTPEQPAGVTHARIVITPDWELLEITKEKEKKVKWYEVSKYATQIEIKVNEEQGEYGFEFNEISLSDTSVFTLDSGCYYSADGTRASDSTYNSYIFVATENCKFYVESSWVTGQYVVDNADGVHRYQKANGTWLSGEANTFDLRKGDRVLISTTEKNLNAFHFYLGTATLLVD